MSENTAVQENVMGTAPMGRLLMKMALPNIISMLVQALYLRGYNKEERSIGP